MLRRFGVLLAAFAVMFVVSSVPVEAQTASYQLAETRWSGSITWQDGRNQLLNAYFRTDGVLVYTDGEVNNNEYDNGRWRQRDLLVTFEMNDYFILFGGLEQAPDHLSGSFFNSRGQQGTWALTRRR